jgi:putative tricarboxylic transport membrane protein
VSPALRRGWLAAGVVMLAVCLFFAWQSWQLSLSDRLGPGSGFFPFWLSLIGAALSIAIWVGALRRRPEAAAEPLWPRGVGLGRIFAILGAIAAAAALLDPLGYRLTALLFLGALAPLLGARSPLAIAAVALAGSFGVYLVFNDWLDVILPVGPFNV